ncbi:MAG: hypothetical protein ACI9C9_002924, partial [Marivirga sp.]
SVDQKQEIVISILKGQNPTIQLQGS